MFGSGKRIRLDPALYERLAAAAVKAGYASTEEFILHVLERAVAGLEEERDEEEVKKQLRGLGYIE